MKWWTHVVRGSIHMRTSMCYLLFHLLFGVSSFFLFFLVCLCCCCHKSFESNSYINLTNITLSCKKCSESAESVSLMSLFNSIVPTLLASARLDSPLVLYGLFSTANRNTKGHWVKLLWCKTYITRIEGIVLIILIIWLTSSRWGVNFYLKRGWSSNIADC